MEILNRIVPDQANLVAMAPAQLASVILEAIRRQPPGEPMQFHRQAISFSGPNQRDHEDVADAITAAWQWMLSQGTTIPIDDNGWRKLSPEGRRLLAAHWFDAGALPQPIPRSLLHPLIVQHAEPQHLGGQHDEAVLAAFRRLEITIRDKIGAPAARVGTDLMRIAFHMHNGPLRDPALPDAERENEAHLFAGAVGAYRNAVGHRDLRIGATEASQILAFVSLLLAIVDNRQVQP